MFSKHLRGKQDDADDDDDDNDDNDDGDSNDEDDGDQNRKCVAADWRIIARTVDRRVAGSKGGASWASQHDGDEDDNCKDVNCNEDNSNDGASDYDGTGGGGGKIQLRWSR